MVFCVCFRLLSRLSSAIFAQPTTKCFSQTQQLSSRTLFTTGLSTLNNECQAPGQCQWASVCVQSVRGRKVKPLYNPSAWKRINKHGIHQRLHSDNGIHILWRRFLKGRHSLAPYERLLRGSIKGRILPKAAKWL